MKIEALAERDGWQCWLCGNEIDPHAMVGSPHAASVDHVIPRAAGGTSDSSNFRLAHRRCNSRRGSKVPELVWPPFTSTVDTAPLWPAVTRMLKTHRAEHVAYFADYDDAAQASSWVVELATIITGESWEAEVISMGVTSAVRLRAC